MTSVLLTAFEPYDLWTANSSWLTLIQLTQQLPSEPAITTRLYPVNFATMKERLAKDLEANYDYALHLGQAPGSTRIQLESHAINIGGSALQSPDTYRASYRRARGLSQSLAAGTVGRHAPRRTHSGGNLLPRWYLSV